MTEIISFIQANGDLTAASILALVVLLIVFGVLVPWRQVNRIIAERDAWHLAHTVSEAARGKLFEEQFKLLETLRLSNLMPTPSRQALHDAGVAVPPNEGQTSVGGTDGTL